MTSRTGSKITNQRLKSMVMLIKNKEKNSATLPYKLEKETTIDFCKILILFNSSQVCF